MPDLDNPQALRRLDASGMLELVESFPGQCRSAIALGRMSVVPRSLKRPYRHVVCTGLGGSAIGADIARSYLADGVRVPIFVNREYRLPRFAGKETLVITASYSGNTEETISAYKDARAKKATIVAITSGGELRKLADRDGHAVVAIPGGIPPRAALGYAFFPLLAVLSRTGIAGDLSAEVDRVPPALEALRDRKIGSAVRSGRNPAKAVAEKIAGRFPVIYSAQDHFDAVATRWRGQLAENAKTLSSTHVFPEMNHNEIMGWQYPREAVRRSAVIMLRDAGDHPRVAKRMDITKRMLRKDGIRVIQVRSEGKGLLERIFSLIYTGDFVSAYLAALNKVDPTSIEPINYLKKELARI